MILWDSGVYGGILLMWRLFGGGSSSSSGRPFFHGRGAFLNRSICYMCRLLLRL